MKSYGRAGTWLALLALSLLLIWLLTAAAMPAALLLGPMIAAIALGIGGVRLSIPRWALIGAQAILGCLVARAITSAILATVAHDWFAMLLVVATTVVAAGLVGWVQARYGSLPGAVVAWGSSPGAASAMVVLAGENGADIRLVAFMQYLRVIVVVLTAALATRLLAGDVHGAAATSAGSFLSGPVGPFVPLLETLAIAAVGALIGRRLGLPAGALLIPMAIGAALHTTGVVEITLPPWLLGVTYVAMGWYIGLGFTRELILYAFRAIPQILLASLALIGLCGFSAWLLTRLLHTDGLTAYLATTPGGLDSVIILAAGSRADIPFVLAIQTLRVFVVILVGPPIARLICRYT